jgi:hypothetical protein
MLLKRAAYNLAGVALSVLPLLWSLSAEAKNLSCSITNPSSGGPGFIAMFGQTFGVECTGLGMTLRGRARLHSTNTGVQVALDGASGTTSANATVFGYDANGQFIPNCILSKTVVSPSFTNHFCSTTVKYLQVSANGSAP